MIIHALAIIVDINTSRPDIENTGINATTPDRDRNRTRSVVTGTTFSRVSRYPGSAASVRAHARIADAEKARAAKVIAENNQVAARVDFVAGNVVHKCVVDDAQRRGRLGSAHYCP